MKCPNDSATLLMTDRQGIEIDYCPDCRGVWLDRGELDKLVEISARQSSTSVSAQPRREEHEYRGQPPQDTYYKKKKRKDFFGEIFDF